jgi:hypothetical protein
MDASWLWNEVDVTGVLKDVENQYKFILAIQEMFAVGSWMNFELAQEKLNKAMTEFNKVSMDILAATYPFVSELRLQARDGKIQGEALEKLCQTVTAQKAEIQGLFRDPERKLPIEILVKNFGKAFADISADEWKQLLDTRQSGAELKESDFRDAMFAQIKSFREESEGRKLMQLWKDLTGFDNPKLWSAARGYPASVLFEDHSAAMMVLGAIDALAESPVDKIKDACRVLESAKLNGESEQEEAFLARFLPKRYAKLNVQAENLAAYFSKKISPAPSEWWGDPSRDDVVLDFVKSNYDSEFRSTIESKIKNMSADDAKAELLKLIATIPDAGIALMS